MSNQLEKAYLELKKAGLNLEHVEEIAKMYGGVGPKVTKDINERFEEITQEMNDLHAMKNADYGDSFGKSLDEDGLVASKVRIGDKFNRFGQLIKNPAQVKEESLRDTLIDMAVYSIKTIIWMEQDKEPKRHKDAMDAATYTAMKILKDTHEQPLIVDNGARVVPVKDPKPWEGKIRMNFKVNANTNVRVRLTEYGIKILQERYGSLNDAYDKIWGVTPYECVLGSTEDGWYRTQLWMLMNIFGPYMSMGNTEPFYLDIIIEDGEPIDE